MMTARGLRIGTLVLAGLAGACRAEPRVTTPASSATTVSSGAMHITPARVDEGMCRTEKSYFPVADAVSVACGSGEAGSGPTFERGASALSPSDEEGLRRIADCATTGPLAGRTLLVIGHADPGAAPEDNRGLGLQRAEHVRDALEALGVDRSRLKVSSRGDLDSDGVDEATWTQDRRVDILLGD